MVNKLYSKIMVFLKENREFVIGLICFYIIINISLPYYIHTSGNLIDISDKVSIEGEYYQQGSINLTYVSEIKGNVLTYLISFILPNWDLVEAEKVYFSNETYEDLIFRNQMFLDEANQNAVFLAYEKANQYINITNQKNYIVYIDSRAKTNLKIKDEIISVNGVYINSMEDYVNIVENGLVGENLNVVVLDENKDKKTKYIEVIEYNNVKMTGLYFITKYNYITNPKIIFNFKETETGPSGGLMMALSIYNKLIEEDITKGRKIVGTGTIDADGNVGEISGIEYKLKGANKNNAEIFLVPKGTNYEKAKLIKKEYNYDIIIIGVSTFKDAINYLNDL